MHLRLPATALAWLDDVRSILATLPSAPDTAAIERAGAELAQRALRLDASATRALTASLDDRDRYRRHLVAGGDDEDRTALLISWPRAHRTTLHDHAGLWGIELVLEGVLEVEEFTLADDSLQPPQLTHQRTLLLGVGDAAVFSGHRYAHRCSNKSSTRTALSLHVYGGVLDAYHAFHADPRGGYGVQMQRAHVDTRPIG
jgi:predicted metal-dependent enzyme (double-stranded beta helix superfamily)